MSNCMKMVAVSRRLMTVFHNRCRRINQSYILERPWKYAYASRLDFRDEHKHELILVDNTTNPEDNRRSDRDERR